MRRWSPHLVLFYVLSCSDEQIFETKTVRVGENINLTCTRRDVGTLFWIKLVSGKFPKILGRSFSSQSDDQHIRTGTEPGTFVLYITKAQQSDTGVYICMKTANRDLTFLNGIYLKVEGPDPVFTTAPSDPVHQEHTVTLQCSVLQDFQNKTCPADGRVLCLSAEPHQSHPDFNYSHMNGGDEYEKNSEELSTKKCFYSYFRNSSDSQNYYCVVATCVESGDKTEGNTEGNKKLDSFSCCEFICQYSCSCSANKCDSTWRSRNSTGNYVKKKSAERFQYTDEDSLVYSVAIFTCRKIKTY
uniref:Ig-like domain-containing protein n=1 Tax=Amphilophus citrinellus TaxID=61819 RepID=A0A3Q0R163_AMPCI